MTTVQPRSVFSLILPKNPLLFANALMFIGFAGLFVPTVELFKGSVSLGRQPVWLAYVGILMPEHWGLVLPIVVLHILLTCVFALILDRLATLCFPPLQILECSRSDEEADDTEIYWCHLSCAVAHSSKHPHFLDG